MNTNSFFSTATGDASASITKVGKKGKTSQHSLFSRLLAQLSHKSGHTSDLATTPQKSPSIEAKQGATEMKKPAETQVGASNKVISNDTEHFIKTEADASGKMTSKADAPRIQSEADGGSKITSKAAVHRIQSEADSSDAVATSIEGISTPMLLSQQKHTPTSASAALTTTSMPISNMASSKSSKLEVGADAEGKSLAAQVLNKKAGFAASAEFVRSAKGSVNTDTPTHSQLRTQDMPIIEKTLVSNKKEIFKTQQHVTTPQISDKAELSLLRQQAQAAANQSLQQSASQLAPTAKSAQKDEVLVLPQGHQFAGSPQVERTKEAGKLANMRPDQAVMKQAGNESMHSQSSKPPQAALSALPQRPNSNGQHQLLTTTQASTIITRVTEAGSSPMQQDFTTNQDDSQLSWLDAGKIDSKLVKQNDFQSHLAYRSHKTFTANQAMLEIVRSAKDGSTKLELQLEPAHLGKVHVTILMDAAKQIQVAIAVDQAASRQALEQHLPQLRLMLAQQGLDLGSFSMQMNQQQHQEQASSSFAQGNIDSHDDVSLPNNPTPTTTRTGVNFASDGHLSMMA